MPSCLTMEKHSLKECELCNKLQAKMVCESDNANLCWVCDVKVHSANLIVARHVRKLLCHVCQSPTEWQASGVRPSPTLSLCNKCFSAKHSARKHQFDENDHHVVTFTPSSASSRCGENDDDARGQHQQYGNGNSSRKHQRDGNDNQVVPFTPSLEAAASASSSIGGNAGDADAQHMGAWKGSCKWELQWTALTLVWIGQKEISWLVAGNSK